MNLRSDLDTHDDPPLQLAVHHLQAELRQAADVGQVRGPDPAQPIREAQPPPGLGQDDRRERLGLVSSSLATAGEPEVPDSLHGVLGQGEGDGRPGGVVGVLQDGLLTSQEVGQVVEGRVVLQEYPGTGDGRSGREIGWR